MSYVAIAKDGDTEIARVEFTPLARDPMKGNLRASGSSRFLIALDAAFDEPGARWSGLVGSLRAPLKRTDWGDVTAALEHVAATVEPRIAYEFQDVPSPEQLGFDPLDDDEIM